MNSKMYFSISFCRGPFCFSIFIDDIMVRWSDSIEEESLAKLHVQSFQLSRIFRIYQWKFIMDTQKNEQVEVDHRHPVDDEVKFIKKSQHSVNCWKVLSAKKKPRGPQIPFTPPHTACQPIWMLFCSYVVKLTTYDCRTTDQRPNSNEGCVQQSREKISSVLWVDSIFNELTLIPCPLSSHSSVFWTFPNFPEILVHCSFPRLIFSLFFALVLAKRW